MRISHLLHGSLVLCEPVCVSLFVEELPILEMIVGIVTSEWVGDDLLICVSEVDIPHIVLIVHHIGVIGIRVPENMKVIFALIMALCHCYHSAGHSQEDIGPDNGAKEVEPGIDGPEELIVRMGREALVSCKVREGLDESDESILHQAEACKPEDTHTGDGCCTPVAIQVLLDGLMEDTIATIIKD